MKGQEMKEKKRKQDTREKRRKIKSKCHKSQTKQPVVDEINKNNLN